MKRLSSCLVVALLLSTVACQPPEMTARDVIAGAKGSLDAAAAKHGECATAPAGKQVCDIINRGNAAKHAAGAALRAYCSGDQFDAGTGPCQPPTDKDAKNQAGQKLKSAIKELQTIVDELGKAV